MSELVYEADVIKAIGESLSSMGEAAGDARRYLTTYMSEDGVGGFMYLGAAERTASVRTSLEPAYTTCAAKVSQTGSNVEVIAAEYTAADTTAEFNAMQDADRLLDVSDLRGGEHYYRSEQLGWRTDLEGKLPEVEFGYSRSNALGWTAFDTPPTDQFFEDATVTNIWYGLKDGIDYLFHLGIDLDPTLRQLGFTNPVKEFADDFKGDWEKIGIAVNAMKMLAGFWKDLGAEALALDTTMRNDVWRGHAAAIASQWLLSFAEATEGHASGLDAEAGEIYVEAGAIYTTVAPLIDLVEGLVDLVDLVFALLETYGAVTPADLLRRAMNPANWLDDLGFAVKRLISILSEIGKKVAKIVLVVDLLFALGWNLRATDWTPWSSPDYALDSFWTSSSLPTMDV